MNTIAENAKAIFLEAVEKHTSADWPVYLDEACGADRELRQRVEGLLQAHQEKDSLFDRTEPAAAPCPLAQPGQMIGPYKLLQKIGEGGMGVIYMAERTQPVEQRVALKIIKPGMDSRQVIARFEAERAALAMMDHPNIARVLDAGTTDSGRPYFVMELVKGVPITEYCNQQKLTPCQRLSLLATVCRAVQHAHQKGIIHRDLKPSNILVAHYDHEPVVKVIDFGVAKATGKRLTEKTLFTRFDQIVGTLEYMSPEQVRFNQRDIDTRTDIYSLGVVLYELLTGTTPFEPKRLHSAAFDELVRIIREEEPPKPSTRLNSTAGTPSLTAAQCSTEPHKLASLLRGDLDWLVMKALDKERDRRYETAASMAADIERYLVGDLIEARPPSALYRLRKFASRNKGAVAAIVTVSFVLLAGIVSTTYVAGRLWQTNLILQEIVVDYRAKLLESALLYACSGQVEKADEITRDLENVLVETERTYKKGSVSSFIKGMALFHAGDEQLSNSQLQKAAELDPEAIGPCAMLAVAACYDGDWAQYVDNILKLVNLPARSPLDEVLRCYGTLYVAPQEAARRLSTLVPKRSTNPFGQSLTAAALGHAAQDTGDKKLVLEAIDRIRLAEKTSPDSPFVLLVGLWVHHVALDLTKLEGGNCEGLLREAKDRAKRLSVQTEYTVGQYETATFIDRNVPEEDAHKYWIASGMVRNACAALQRDGKIDEAFRYLDSHPQSRYSRLCRLILQIGRRSPQQILADYDQLIHDETDIAFRLESLEALLLLGNLERFQKDAKEIARAADKYRGVVVWLDPLADYLSDGDEQKYLANVASEHSKYTELRAHFWIGLVRLAKDDTEGAIDEFENCLRTGAFD